LHSRRNFWHVRLDGVLDKALDTRRQTLKVEKDSTIAGEGFGGEKLDEGKTVK
jgi:hypothetical protein